MAKSFELIPQELPRRRGRGTVTLYRDVLDEFIAGSVDSVAVKIPGKKPTTLALQLRKAAKASGAPVVVAQRGEDVYLIRSK